MLLWLAIPHGINGLRNVLQDYIHNPGLNRIITAVLVPICDRDRHLGHNRHDPV